MTTADTRTAIQRLMKYASAAMQARHDRDLVHYWDLRTSTDDCRIAIRATTGSTS